MRIQIIFILVLCSFLAIGQNTKLSISNKRAIALYEKAIYSYDNYDLESAIELLNESIDKEKKFVEAYLLLTQIYQEKRDFEKAIATAQSAISINPDYYSI